MKIVVSEIFVAVIVTIVVQSHAAKLSAKDRDMDTETSERQQVKREVVSASSAGNLQGDGKSLNGPPGMGLGIGNMQAFARYPNYGANFGGMPQAGAGLMFNVGGIPTGLGGAIYPYEMNYETLPSFAGGNFPYGGAYPVQYPVGGGVTPQFGLSQQLQNYPGQQIPLQQQIPGQYPIQSQLAQQQLQLQQQQFLTPQPQQQQSLGGLQVLPSVYQQFGYSPAFRGYQYNIGNAM